MEKTFLETILSIARVIRPLEMDRMDFCLIKRTLRWKIRDHLLIPLSRFSVGRALVERSRQKFNSVRNNGVKRWPASVLGPIRLYTISWESKHLPTIPNETRQALMRSRLPADGTQMPSSPREAFPSITRFLAFFLLLSFPSHDPPP